VRFREYLENDKLWVLANVRGEISPGGPHRDLCSTTRNWPGAFFCSGLHRKWLLRIRGFDEDYVLAGHDDDDLAFRLIECSGLKQIFVNDIRAEHQWHEPAPYKAENREMFEFKRNETRARRMSHVRNVGREWGVP
jgi:GT2 family glycosyltransferase